MIRLIIRQIFHPYRFYRAWKANKRPYKMVQEERTKYSLAASMKQCQSKFPKWKCYNLIKHEDNPNNP